MTSAVAHIATVPQFAKTGFRWNPYDTQHGMTLSLATHDAFDKANYALCASAGFCDVREDKAALRSIRLQDIVGSRIIRRMQNSPANLLTELDPNDPTVDIFVGGLCYYADVMQLVHLITEACGQRIRIYAIELIPGKGGAMPTSCKLVVHADDEAYVTSLDHRAIIVGAGLLVGPYQQSLEDALAERNNALSAARAAAGYTSRAALRALVFQRRQEQQQPSSFVTTAPAPPVSQRRTRRH